MFKAAVSILLLMFEFQVWAYPCPKVLGQEPLAARAQLWFAKFKGVTNLKNCKIEITVCDESEPQSLEGPLAELYILETSGREVYLPINFSPAGTPKLKTKLHVRDQALNYKRTDRYIEPEFGRTEVYRLEMLTEWRNPDKLKSLDLGTYATNKQLNQPSGNDSRWYNCGE